MKAGIPRALLYYKYAPFWEGFLESCGVKVVKSPPTNKAILKKGVEEAESEICLPVKVFYGHAIYLAEKVDFLLIPRVVRVEKKAYTCPKLLGLPDMIRGISDVKIISPLINLGAGFRSYVESWCSVADFLGVNRNRAWHAFKDAWLKQKVFERKRRKPLRKGVLRIGLAGHSYSILDKYLSFNLVERLKSHGAEVLLAEEVPPREREVALKGLPKSIFWSYEKEIVGAAMHWAKKGLVHGIIFVNSFACGPDSLMQMVVENEVSEKCGLPVMSLVLDEHSSEVGFLTRIEAFLDMLSWKRRREE